MASLSVCIITLNEGQNLARTLEAVRWAGEIIVVDSGSTDGTQELARGMGAKVFEEPWKGFAAQKNSAIAKATGDWVLSLDADEEVEPGLAAEIRALLKVEAELRVRAPELNGYWMARKNFFLGRWIRRGGFYPDRKLRLFRRGAGQFEDRAVHETVQVRGETRELAQGALLHHAYPTLAGYLEHMNKYSSLGAEMSAAERPRGFSLLDIVVRPRLTFFYNYFLRLGFLDGREGLLLHLYHANYVSWKYAKAWELSRRD